MALIRIICVVLAWGTQANDVIDVSHQWEVTPIHGPSQVGIVQSLAVDLNDDGWMDVVSASIDDGHIRAYINPQIFPDPSDLNFIERIIDTDFPGVYRLIHTDINDDGLVDFIATSIESHEIAMYRQQQDGTFIKSLLASDIILPTDVIVLDVNDDGRLDVVSSSFQNNTLYLHKQSPSGTFSTETLVPDVLSPRKLTQADFNNDNKPDFALASSGDNSIRLFINEGDQTWQVIVLTDQANGTRYVNHCDVNRDGWIDLIVSKTVDNTLSLFTNMGDGSYVEKVIDDEAFGITTTLCRDLDADNQPDITTIHSNSGNIYGYLNSNNMNRHLVANSRDGYISLDAADFTQQNQVQLLTQTHFQHRNLTYHPIMTNQELIVWQDFPDGAESIRLGDVNNDGIEDIVLGSFRDDTVQWYDGQTHQRHIIDNQVDGVNEILIVDLDDDGLVDVLSAASYANAFYWHRNLGFNQFETLEVAESESFANALAVVDVNQDGQLDVIGTAGSADTVKWFERDGYDFFSHLISSGSDGPNDIFIAKIYDHSTDVYVSYYFSDEIIHLSWTENDIDVSLLSDVIIRPVTIFGFPLWLNKNDSKIIVTSKIQGSIFKIEDVYSDPQVSQPLIEESNYHEVVSLGLINSIFVGSTKGITQIIPNHKNGFTFYSIVLKAEINSISGADTFLIGASFNANGVFRLKFYDTIFMSSF